MDKPKVFKPKAVDLLTVDVHDLQVAAKKSLQTGADIMELTVKLVKQYHKNPVRDWLDKPLPALKKLAKLYVKMGIVEKPARQVKL